MEETILNDMILISHTDVVKGVINKSTTQPYPFVQFFNDNNNVFTACGTILTLIAIIISLYAVNKSTKVSHHQILVSKLEEMCGILNDLQIEYFQFYNFYERLSKLEDIQILKNKKESAKITANLDEELSKIDFNQYFDKLSRLNVLVSAYLNDVKNVTTFKTGRPNWLNSKLPKKSNLKYDIIVFIEIYNSLLLILMYKENNKIEFLKKVPSPDTIGELVRQLIYKIMDKMGYVNETNDKGYEIYRNTIFEKNLYSKTEKTGS
ncbi:hypothetical protein [Flavobacterium sp. Root186]|uniref:hypothetical protein n=1 Tax=Flavobacterium sp. Root186 TaxID=1736485 RepID=UPI0006FB0883|nr:hypothetical protein [Flavobacterium sp. Root186]KRB56793.1 hypothetical protein ASD98_08895 [Flavobacterium sp. Root186]